MGATQQNNNQQGEINNLRQQLGQAKNNAALWEQNAKDENKRAGDALAKNALLVKENEELKEKNKQLSEVSNDVVESEDTYGPQTSFRDLLLNLTNRIANREITGNEAQRIMRTWFDELPLDKRLEFRAQRTQHEEEVVFFKNIMETLSQQFMPLLVD